MRIFKKLNILKKQKDNQNASKKYIFLGTSILSRFWEGFGLVFGGKNSRFLHFWECFFGKNRYKIEVTKNKRKKQGA